MTNRLVIITVLMLIAATVTIWAAPGDRTIPLTNRQLMGYSSVKVFNDTDRMPIYQNTSARNITGKQLASLAYQAAWNPDYVKVFQVNSTASTSPNAGIKITSVIRDRRGVIQKIEYENGGHSIGTPNLHHTYVYPFSGMTNVRRQTPLVLGTIWAVRGIVAVPSISIEGISGIVIKGLYYGGKNARGMNTFGYVNETVTNQNLVDAFFWGTSSVGTLAANTTYTIRTAMDVSWGRSSGSLNFGAPDISSIYGSNSCRAIFANGSTGTVFSRYSAVGLSQYICRSTFRTGSAL